MTDLRFAHIGMNHLVQVNRVVAVMVPDTKCSARYVARARDSASLIDATRGRHIRSVLLMDDNTVIISSIKPMTLMKRFSIPYDQMNFTAEEDDEADFLDTNEEAD